MFETALAFAFLIFILAMLTAIFGILTGLGGGILMVPILTFFHIDIRYAMGVSLITIIALSLVTATTKTSKMLTDVKIGVFLETAAVIGAIVGAMLVPFIPVKILAILFGTILIFVASIKHNSKVQETPLAAQQALSKRLSFYSRIKLLQAWLAMLVSGGLSGVLGIGSGALKVLAMDRIIGLPYKVSLATSNFMIGMTATASIGIYYFNNYIRYELIFPVVLGVYVGTHVGARFLVASNINILRNVFRAVIYILALQMLYKGLK